MYILNIKRVNEIGKEKFVDGVKHMEEIINDEQYSDLHVLDMFCIINLSYLV